MRGAILQPFHQRSYPVETRQGDRGGPENEHGPDDQDEGRKADHSNYLLMHAMGPNVAGVIGSALAAGYFLAMFGN